MLDHRIVYSGQSIARPLRPSPSGASLLSAAKLAGANSKSNGSPGGPHAGKVASHQTGTATEHAPADSPAGKMVAAGRHRLLQLPRGADKTAGNDRGSLPRHQTLGGPPTAAEPERLDDLGADQAV